MKSLKLQHQQRLLYYQKKKNPSKNLRQKEATMSPSFVFDPPSVEEIEHEEHKEEEESVGEPQSESESEEHARKSTTSVDEKISKALKQRSTPLVAELDHSFESEPDEQVIIGFLFFFFVHSYTLLGFYSYTIEFFLFVGIVGERYSRSSSLYLA